MKSVHINAGNEYGGGLVHVVSLLKELKEEADLIVFEEGPVAEAARREDLTVFVFKQNSRYDLRVLFELKRFIEQEGYDVVHTHGPRANTLLAILRKSLKAKWVVTVHSHPLLDFRNRGVTGKIFEKINRKAITQADGVIAVSNEIKESVMSFGLPEKKVTVIHNGIRFSGSTESDHTEPQNMFTVVTVGRLHSIKGYSLLMDVFGQIKWHNWKWVVCGTGEEKEKLLQQGENLGISSHLHFAGWLSPAEVKRSIHQADLLVHPSLSESFPLVLLEAAEQRIPVIATDVGDVACLVKDRTMGWLITAGNKTELKEALDEAYRLWKTRELSQKGRMFHQWAQQFSIERQAELVRSFYHTLLS